MTITIINCKHCNHQFTTKKLIKVQCPQCYQIIKLDNYIDKRFKS